MTRLPAPISNRHFSPAGNHCSTHALKGSKQDAGPTCNLNAEVGEEPVNTNPGSISLPDEAGGHCQGKGKFVEDGSIAIAKVAGVDVAEDGDPLAKRSMGKPFG